MKKPKQNGKSIYDKREAILINLTGLLKAELIRRASAEGYNHNPQTYLKIYLKEKWKI